MSVPVHVVADPEDAALAGIDGVPVDDAHAVVLLGDARPPPGAQPERTVFWHASSATSEEGRTIAPDGSGLWRRAPWPAADAVFDLPPPPAPRVLVAAADAERRRWIVRDLEGRGVDAAPADRLTAAALREVSAVVLLAAESGHLPAEAMAVLAARRVLITGPAEPSFGLQPEIEFFPGAQDDDQVVCATAAARWPAAFAAARSLGARAAEHHRASSVYARLLVDLELETGGRSPDPRGAARKSSSASSS